MSLKVTISLLSVLILSSCGETVPVKVKLDLPAPLYVPVLPAKDIECVSNKTYLLIEERNELKDDYIEELKDIIKSTH